MWVAIFFYAILGVPVSFIEWHYGKSRRFSWRRRLAATVAAVLLWPVYACFIAACLARVVWREIERSYVMARRNHEHRLELEAEAKSRRGGA